MLSRLRPSPTSGWGNRALEATEINGDKINMIERKLPKPNLDIGVRARISDGLDTHANSDVPSIASQSIQDQSLRQFCKRTVAGRVEHRLKNNLQILVASWSRIPQGPQLGSSRGAVDAYRTHRGDRNAQQAYYWRAWLNRRERAGPGQRGLRQCPNSVGSDVSSIAKRPGGIFQKETAMPLALIINDY